MKTAPNRWIWPLCAVSSVSVLLYVGSVAHAGKPGQARSGSNASPRYVTPGPAPVAMPGHAPYYVVVQGQGGQLVQTLTPRADLARSVDRCLVPVRDVDPQFVVTPKATDERMIVAPVVVGLPVQSRR